MIESFLRYLEHEKRLSPHTLTAYSKDLDQFFSFCEKELGISSLADCKHAHLRSWVVHLIEHKNSSKTVNRKIATLKSLYKFLLAREYIIQNPASRLKPLKTEKPLPVFVRETEMEQLLDRIDFPETLAGQRDRLILELLYNTGIRLSELIGIKKGDVNSFQKTIKVLGKRNKERVIPLNDFLVKLINDFKQQGVSNSPYLLVTDSGDQLYPMYVYRTVKKYLDLITTQTKKSPHVLRHTFATHLLNKGAELSAVKDLLGHTSLAATQVYTHNSIEKLKSVFDQAHPKA